MTRILFPLAALLLTVTYGVGEGLWTDRWRASGAAEQAAARLADVPRTLGGWDAEDQELDPRQVAAAELKGYVLRRYTHRESGAAVSVLLVCGRPGPVSVHTPDVCFQGAGQAMKGTPQRQRFEVADLTAAPEFWTARFDRTVPGTPVPEPTTVLWGWAADGRWSAPENPRVEFARSGALYKLYVIRPVTKPDGRPADDPALVDFLRTFLPALQTTLFPAA
jgi:hypothetical protein